MKKLVQYMTAGAMAVMLSACDVDMKDKGKMPEVDVKEGRAPDVDVRGPDVDVGTDKKTITVPDVDVRVPKENDPS